MRGKDENGEYRDLSKSMRKREADAAQDLGTRLIALRESDLAALNLPETLHDAILLAKRITSRGGLARQRQYIGKLMRDIDPAPIEAALNVEARASAQDAERPVSCGGGDLEACREHIWTSLDIASTRVRSAQLPWLADEPEQWTTWTFPEDRILFLPVIFDPVTMRWSNRPAYELAVEFR